MHTVVCILEGANNVKTPVIMQAHEASDECVFIASDADVKTFLQHECVFRLSVCLYSTPSYRTEMRRSDWFAVEDKTFHACSGNGFGFWVDRMGDKSCIAFTILKYIFNHIKHAHDTISGTWLDSNPKVTVYKGKHSETTIRFPDKDVSSYADAIAALQAQRSI